MASACNGNPAQQFVLSGAGDLVNPQANTCVDMSLPRFCDS
jgi:streptogrisin C